MKLTFRVGRNNPIHGEPYPWISRPFRGEIGPVGADEWTVRYYMIFVARRSVSLGVHR